MAKLTTPGIWLPGPLNTVNSTSPTGQADIAGNPYYMGMNPGKIIVLGQGEAQSAAAPGTTLYDGTYQVVQLDSSATAALATQGYAAYIRLDSGATQGALPESAYNTPVVTTGDVANTLGLNGFFAGVFINPATLPGGLANGPTPGNYTVIFVGAGRAQVAVGTVAAVAVGNAVFPDTNHAGLFEGSATNTTTPGIQNGLGVAAGAVGASAVAYYREIIFRFGGF
jgi:hypothetical protein